MSLDKMSACTGHDTSCTAAQLFPIFWVRVYVFLKPPSDITEAKRSMRTGDCQFNTECLPRCSPALGAL